MPPDTTTLYRPVGEKELALIRESGWRRFPPRLEWQPEGSGGRPENG